MGEIAVEKGLKGKEKAVEEAWYDEKVGYGFPSDEDVERAHRSRSDGRDDGWLKLWDIKGDCREIGTMETYGA
jgi:hypothetical protein